MIESSRLHPALKRVLSTVQVRGPAPAALCPLGVPSLDRAIGGGLAMGRLHEVFARDADDEASALAFVAMLAARLRRNSDDPASAKSGAILWLREESIQRRAGLSGPGLVEIGLDPARLVLGVLPDAKALLRASADALRSAGLSSVILELGGNPALLDLTASRRLALAAETSGVTPLLLRVRGATPMPSAAQTRWEIGAMPSAPLEAGAPGHPALAASLLRQRGGQAGLDWIVEWDRDAGIFRSAALPGARLPLSGGGSIPSAGEETGAGWRIAS